jgi:hypothetical protein
MVTTSRDLARKMHDQLAVARNFTRLLEELPGENASRLGGQSRTFLQPRLDLVSECSFERDDREFGSEVGWRLDAAGRFSKVMLHYERGETFHALESLADGRRIVGSKGTHQKRGFHLWPSCEWRLGR